MSHNPLLRAVFCGFLLACLCSCASLRPDPPEVSLERLQVSDFTLSHATLLAGLRLYNPNSIDLTIERVNYSLSLNGIKVSSGQSLESVSLPANDYGDVTLRLSAAYLDLLRFIQTAQKGDLLNYSLLGEVEVAGMGFLNLTYPLKREGTIRFQTSPESRP